MFSTPPAGVDLAVMGFSRFRGVDEISQEVYHLKTYDPTDSK